MASPGKRIMSFDGGGIRGIFSLQIAARIEQLFRDAYGTPDLVLADVIDFFAGTSTGAIIAAFLAWGGPVEQVQQLYLNHGKAMFARQRFWRRLKGKYRAEQLEAIFKQEFREQDGTFALLDSKKLRALLLIVMRNATTGSPWPLSSNPLAKYNAADLPDCNLKLPIWKLLRASTAAPTFFPPEEITLGNQTFLFVDGGVTPYNNPALLALLMATLPCYRLNWDAGRDRIHLISVGTGGQRTHFHKTVSAKINVLDHLRFVIPGLIETVSANQDMLCRVLGHCIHGSQLDSEIGCLEGPSLLSPAEQKFSYVRYNCRLDSQEVGTPMSPAELMLDNLHAMGRLQEVGTNYAIKNVLHDHLMLGPRNTAAVYTPGHATPPA